MGFFSFGKKKKAEPALPTPPPKAKVLSRPSPSTLANGKNTASATSTLSAISSGSSSGSPPQPQKRHTVPVRPEPPQQQQQHRRSLSFAPDASPRVTAKTNGIPPVPPIPAAAASSASGLKSSSSNSLLAPYANRELAKKGSTNTLNSMNGGKRGPHDPPRLADGLAKPRSASYHAPQLRNIWVTSASNDGHTMMAANTVGQFRGSKYHSTGSPMISHGSYYGDVQYPQHNVSDPEFKEYTRNYEAAISKAHSLAREYHHLPMAKRDKQRFELVGHSFAAAARISREHWSYRCALEKERLEALLANNGNSGGNRLSQADVFAQDASPHRVAGMRATEGWQYASMLADAWGSNEEMTTPLEDMLTIKPNYSSTYGGPSSYYNDYGYSNGYVHPGYNPGVYASYSTRVTDSPPIGTESTPNIISQSSRPRMDSTASRISEVHSSSTHTHSGVSHSLRPSRSQGALSSSGGGAQGVYAPSSFNRSNPKVNISSSDPPPLPEPLPPLPTSAPATRTSFSGISGTPGIPGGEDPVVTRAPIKLTKGRKYRERTSVTATAVAVS